jgi:hypothetical protein
MDMLITQIQESGAARIRDVSAWVQGIVFRTGRANASSVLRILEMDLFTERFIDQFLEGRNQIARILLEVVTHGL